MFFALYGPTRANLMRLLEIQLCRLQSPGPPFGSFFFGLHYDLLPISNQQSPLKAAPVANSLSPSTTLAEDPHGLS